jgi:hypothetical protein
MAGVLLLSLTGMTADLPPDLTRGGKPDNEHRWTLGATGARGWVWSKNIGGGIQSDDARQILITEVAKGSPADGVLKKGDVVTGLNGQAFDGDARHLFAQAVTEAEKESNGGVLKLIRWRAGKTENVQLKLQVLGTYAATAPYGCAKSKRIFEQGCAAIAKKGFKDTDNNVQISIENDMNALALLALVASGRAEYRPLVTEYAQKVAECKPELDGLPTWEYAYNTLFLAEYALATKDATVLAGLRRLSLDIARGMSGVGTWGHGFVQPSGNLGGYGCMNQPGITLTLAMVLAREAGVKDPDLNRGIAKASGFLRQWVNRGAIPYGDHEPWPWHDDNGKCSDAAVLFDLLGDQEAASFYSRMGTAAYAERESGHCGNFFNILWALPGVSRCGPAATAAYFNETSWYYDLARGWDGRVEFVGFPGEDSFNGWDCTGAYLLGYALPLKSLYITGRKPGAAQVLSPAEVAETIEAGRGFTFQNWERKEWYAERNTDALLTGLSSWSPAVRLRSAQALGHREGDFLPQILKLLDSSDRNSRYGACEALANLGPKADSAAPQVRALLNDKDPWLRMLAARTLPCMGPKVRTTEVASLLRAASLKDATDPRQRLVGEVAKALFAPMPGTDEPKPILSESLEGVDRPLLYAALKEILANEDGLIRGLAAGIYPLLSADDVKALLPEIVAATRKNAPSGEMFRMGIRWAGLELLARFRIREGMGICVDMMNEYEWGRELDPCIKPLKKFGGAAKEVIPRLRETMAAMPKGYEANQWNSSLTPDIQSIKKLIKEIESDKNPAPVLSVEEFTGKPAASESRTGDGVTLKAHVSYTSKGTVKVFILAGQSNMEGYAGVQTLDRLGEHPTHGYLLKKIRKDDGSFIVRDDVFVSYKKEDEHIKRPLSVGMGALGEEWFGPELMFGIEMGDFYQEPVLLIKTCWGGHSLYGNFRPPSAGKPAYQTDCKPDEMGASYHKMVKEVRECLANLDTDFAQLKGCKPELCGFVWFQGWNDLCAGDEIKQQVYDEYCPNFVHLVQDLRAEFKMPNLPVVMGELGVNGKKADKDMIDFRSAQAKIATCRELKGTLGYVHTAPFWYPKLDEMAGKLEAEEARVRNAVEPRITKKMKGKPESKNPDKMEELINEAVEKAKEKDTGYLKVKKEADKHICHWGCHYYGSARVYCMVGYSLAEAMKPLLNTKP